MSFSILIFLSFYYFIDEGLGSSPEKTNRLATNLIFYLPLILISPLLILRIIKIGLKSEFERSKANLIGFLFGIILYAYFWLY